MVSDNLVAAPWSWYNGSNQVHSAIIVLNIAGLTIVIGNVSLLPGKWGFNQEFWSPPPPPDAALGPDTALELQTNHRQSFHNHRESPCLKAPTSAITFKTLC